MTKRYTREELAAATGRTIPDVIGPHLDVLFSGINPGLMSAVTGHHFARPGNRFWPALHRSGFTPRLMRPDEQDELVALGLGITNVVARATAGAAELLADEYKTGGKILRAKVEEYQPRWLAVVGIGAYRTAFAKPKAVLGRQPDTLGKTGLWVLPNPSGLNAHFTVETLAEEFAHLRAAVEEEKEGGVASE
ncbi:G/U mismatch-specific DNA glycosylase [Yinghuangia seranimata]|uniref:G/U mismatch-specific DNA glycosylase n=1 Tax=Yinghuangia seranimata TaxID=408067 RepID=UPI00248BF625|nr:G/U mismatch-specific DNA glycosylase [Yinghuangia seranimata]MDI2130610.1 G/U mismatch-specific DNA glycosylase [Yinghuangia seranimata]